jgi:hypothetical protein
MDQPRRGPAKKVPVQIRLVDEPDGTTLRYRVPHEVVDKAAEILRRSMPLSPWRCHFDIRPGGPGAAGVKPDELRLDWHCVRTSTGHAVWSWNGTPVAVTLFLGGRDADDARAVEHWAKVQEPQVPASLLKRVREGARPLLATAYLGAEPTARRVIAKFSLGLSQRLCEDFKIHKASGPLGPAVPRDFPAQFLHLIAAEGAMRRRHWAEAKTFSADADIRQVLATFNDRLEDSFSGFDERLSIGTAKGLISIRVCWQGLHPTAGIAEMIDARCVRHEMLLLGRKDTAAGDVGQRFANRFPKRGWEAVLNEIRTAPRPLLATVTRPAPPQGYGAGALLTGAALAAALFRRIGAF